MKIDFYLLNHATQNEAWIYTCRLIEKAFQKGHQIFIQCDTLDDAISFDNLLWEYDPASFIPHNIQGEGPLPIPSVQIGYLSTCQGFHDILINLSSQVPVFHEQFKRICEIVYNDETIKSQKRLNYRQYQTKAHLIQTHSVNT